MKTILTIAANQEGAMKKVLALTAVAETVTGVILLAYPPVVVRLLFATEISGAGVLMSRIAGIALIGLGAACWSGNNVFQPLIGMLTYSTLAMLYLIVVGVRGEGVGLLLWPAVVAHAILIVLLAGVWLKQRKSPAT
jgi:drug/metabolite transporter (DMT)-like permease